MSIKSQKDFVSGLMFTAVGAGFAWNSALSYDIGSANQMGPGYFPLVLGLVLVLLGGFIMFFSLVVETPDGGVIGDIAWRPLVCILGANLLFGALLADATSFNLRRMLVLSSILAGGSYLVFISLLNLQLPVWPAFISGH